MAGERCAATVHREVNTPTVKLHTATKTENQTVVVTATGACEDGAEVHIKAGLGAYTAGKRTVDVVLHVTSHEPAVDLADAYGFGIDVVLRRCHKPKFVSNVRPASGRAVTGQAV